MLKLCIIVLITVELVLFRIKARGLAIGRPDRELALGNSRLGLEM